MSFNSKYTGAQVEAWLDNIKNYSANDILTKLKTVDGENSGLDADLLDGQQGSWYQNNVIAFRRYEYTGTNQYDANVGTSGMLYNYGSNLYWKNTPEMSYGQILTLRSGDLTLAGQLAWDVNHASTTDTTRYLWWRATDAGDWIEAKWHQIAFTDSNVASATKASQDEAGSNIVATYVKKTVLESFQYFQYRGTCNNINAQTLPGMYDYADTSNAIAGTNYGILLCFYNRDFPTTWAWGVQVFFGDNNKFAYRTSIRKSGVWNNWVIVA